LDDVEMLMTRLWWFCLWLWEWFWHPQGMLVWAEANQGMLSIAALVTALVFFLLEQKRANQAEKAAKDAAREAELREQQKFRLQKIDARANSNTEKRRQTAEFVATTIDLMDGFVARGREGLVDKTATTVGFLAIETEIVGALRSLARTCPNDPALLRLLHRAIATVEYASGQDQHLSSRLGVEKNLKKFVDRIEKSLGEIASDLRERQGQLAKLWS
jgi:hypothetical protein